LKIVAFGNCQQFSLAQRLQALLTEHDVRDVWDGNGLDKGKTENLSTRPT